MNWDRIEGNWKQFKGQLKEKWGRFTDDELDVVAGKRDQFLGKLQEKYGITKDEAQRQLLNSKRTAKTFHNRQQGKVKDHRNSKGRTSVRPFAVFGAVSARFLDSFKACAQELLVCDLRSECLAGTE
jgi:uncharacterized protein YjbJ (UPF0337 family)